MSFELLLTLSLVVVGFSFILIPLLPSRLKSAGAFLLVFVTTILTSIPAFHALFQGNIEMMYPGGSVFGTIPVRIDALSAWFILIVNFTAFNGAFYGLGYMKGYESQQTNTSLHWILFVIFQTSMLWVCMVQNSFAFLISWEIMSASSLLLLMFDHGKSATLKAGLNYLVQMHIGVGLLIIAFVWCYFSTSTFDFLAIEKTMIPGNGRWLLLLFFAGFGIKAGFIPLHTWLPHAHSAAPSHISGVMSGVIVKMGIYGILRVFTFLKTDLVLTGEILLVISSLTAFYGILNAAVNRDFKRLLAFCTIENIGIIGMGIGLGLIGKGMGSGALMLIGFSGAFLHILNHALYKSLLFFASGNIYLQTHTRNMEELGGLIKRMPRTAFVYLCGAIAICGLPPFNGFISEFLIYSGLISGISSSNIQFSALMIICIAVLAIVGGISIFTFTKSFGTIFLGSPRKNMEHQPEEVKFYMHIPMILILMVMVFIGIFPSLIMKPLVAMVNVFDTSVHFSDEVNKITQFTGRIGVASLALFLLSLAIWFIKEKLAKSQVITQNTTWGCGYVAPSPKIQYTSRSYTRSLAKLFNYLLPEEKRYKEIAARSIFPEHRKYHSYFKEFFEYKFLDKMVKLIFRFVDYFTFIHNGRIQLYILYGVFFILMLLIATIVNLI